MHQQEKNKHKSPVHKGWTKHTYQLITQNKIVISFCLLIHGLFFVFLPEHSLILDVKVLMALTALYAVSCAVVVITNGHEKAEKRKTVVGGMYKWYWDDKKKQMLGPRQRLMENELIQQRTETVQAQADTLAQYSEQRRQRLLQKKWLLVVLYLLLAAVCVPLFIFSSFTDHAVHALLGLFITADGVVTFVAALKARNTIHRHDRLIALAAAVFSVVLGVFLMVLPSVAAQFLVQIAGIGFIVKALAELWVAFHNRKQLLLNEENLPQESTDT